MLKFTYRPITLWPGAMTRNRQRARFRAPYSNTLKLLDRELRHLLAKQIVLQVALSEADIRQDGRPRAGSKPRHPGVILAFQSRHGPLSYPCDTYSSWEDNLRAITLALEHLRAVDRYGVTRRGEQYQGWARLPGPIITPSPMTVVEADAWLRRTGGGPPILTTELLEAVYRRAAFATHPDRGGSSEGFQRVQQARAVLEQHFARQ
jgi:hypothetical protein